MINFESLPPIIYGNRVAPCFIEPLLALISLLIAISLYIRAYKTNFAEPYRQPFHFAEDRPLLVDMPSAGSNESQANHAPQSRNFMAISKWMRWIINTSRLMVGYMFVLVILYWAVLLSTVRPDSWDYSNDFYVISVSVLALAWFLVHRSLFSSVHKVIAAENGSKNFDVKHFLWFYCWSALVDIYLIFSRSQILASPKNEDPVLLGGNLEADIFLISLRLIMTFIVLSIGTLKSKSLFDRADKEQNVSAFSDFSKKVTKLFPFMWPRKSIKLQLLFFACIALLVCARVINVLSPLQYKKVVDALSAPVDGTRRFPVAEVLLFVFFYFLQGGSGLTQTLQSVFWIPIEQYTTREVSVKVFEHLHNMSLRWHLNRKTGEVLRVMDRGTQAITSLVSYIAFNIVPVLVDIFIAVIFFVIQFDIMFGIIVLTTMILYLVVTISITEWRTKYRRKMIELDNKTNSKAVDSLLNFETVKYYGNEKYELNTYQQCIRDYQDADWVSQISLRILNSMQNVVITIGMLIGSLLCASKVSKGELGVGDFVMFIAYLQQLYAPLNWFGTYYRMINQNFIDMEKMLDLMSQEAEVIDAKGAEQLKVTCGHIKFEHVFFTYDPKKSDQPNLKDINFEIPPGKTVALCGPSGAGKSSLIRLLFRFYEVSSGRILIDGQDIKTVTQQSLRKEIGVVPQDTVLFNDTLRYNIRYGKIDATEHDLVNAASQAQVHDKILKFPDGYETQVGERGLRLSGGEKQRIAIARTLLKNPKIVLLDEATSALDSTTEALIQGELTKMTEERTTLIVAHRLSTIVNADLILVLKDGEIHERGTHEQLLEIEGGIYQEMWNQQKRQANQTE